MLRTRILMRLRCVIRLGRRTSVEDASFIPLKIIDRLSISYVTVMIMAMKRG
ncbi:hypothetical protein KEJ39_02095 [Candidatus Bathyarchaeota archaeon]|nr:hypothetical protein [Candidatus Bathyarchaeota archaeon]